MTQRSEHTRTAPIITVARSGPLGRWGTWMVDHRRSVLSIWFVVLIGLGVLAPSAERQLSGAGWQADSSESVTVRQLVQEHFAGNGSYAIQVVVHSTAGPLTGADGRQVITQVTRILQADPRLNDVVAPVPGVTLSRDGRTAVVLGGAGVDTNRMVRVAADLKGPLQALSTPDVEVNPTGASVLWSDFNDANLHAMLSSELFSWPVTMIILVLAFGALVAAGLPLVLTLAGLVASAGCLVLINELVPVSIWAMNFALMFSLALGIDYALFLVVRYRSARGHRSAREAVAETMDTAGKAVLLSGVTMLLSLSAVLLVPSPSFRSAAGGIILSVAFVLAATLTLLPLTLFTLDDKLNRFALPWTRTSAAGSLVFARWGEWLWRRPVAWGLSALVVLLAVSAPVIGVRTAMPSIKVLPEHAPARVGYRQVQEAFGPGAPAMLQVVVDRAEAPAAEATLSRDPAITGVLPPASPFDGSDHELLQAIPSTDPSDPGLAEVVSRLRAELPASAQVGGFAVEDLDLKAQLDRSTPIVIEVILGLGFLLVLFALQAPLVALLGTAVSLLSTAGAFGLARWVFQDGHGSGLLGFEPQGFLDAWAPVFFFAMIFAIAMDYTVFLLAVAKEQWELSKDPYQAMVGAMARSGRVIFAAGGVMVAVFFTFALAAQLPVKEMGTILGFAVLLDAFLVRLTLLPVLLRLTGAAAWYTPRWLSRVLPAITFAHG
ncbi:MAG: MMPL family transporter [Nocardioides sp.]